MIINNIYAIILAGGMGRRLNSEKPKQFLPLGSGKKPIIIKTIEQFHTIDEIDEIICTSHIDYIEEFKSLIEDYKLNKVKGVVKGGKTRQLSVYNALCSKQFEENDLILIHDGARPFITGDVIWQCIESSEETGGCSVYVPAVDTITEVEDGFVKSIPDRDKLYYTQTPQCFKYSIIKDSHEKALNEGIENSSDDVSMALRIGYKIKMVSGEYKNIKITTPEDYRYAQWVEEKRELNVL